MFNKIPSFHNHLLICNLAKGRTSSFKQISIIVHSEASVLQSCKSFYSINKLTELTMIKRMESDISKHFPHKNCWWVMRFTVNGFELSSFYIFFNVKVTMAIF